MRPRTGQQLSNGRLHPAVIRSNNRASRPPSWYLQLLVVLQELQFLGNAKFTSTKANTNNEEAVARPRPQGKETQHALGIALID